MPNFPQTLEVGMHNSIRLCKYQFKLFLYVHIFVRKGDVDFFYICRNHFRKCRQNRVRRNTNIEVLKYETRHMNIFQLCRRLPENIFIYLETLWQ